MKGSPLSSCGMPQLDSCNTTLCSAFPPKTANLNSRAFGGAASGVWEANQVQNRMPWDKFYLTIIRALMGWTGRLFG